MAKRSSGGSRSRLRAQDQGSRAVDLLDQLLGDPAVYALVEQRLRALEKGLVVAQPTSEVARSSPPKISSGRPRVSYKGGKKLTITVGFGPGMTIRLTGLKDAVFDLARRFHTDEAWARALGPVLGMALTQAARSAIEPKRRIAEIDELAGVAALFIEAQAAMPEDARVRALGRAEAELAQHFGPWSDWTGRRPRERRLLLAAYFVHRTLKLAGTLSPRRLRWLDPTRPNFDAESFRRVRVDRGRKLVREELALGLHRLAERLGIDPQVVERGLDPGKLLEQGADPRVRRLLDPWYKNADARQALDAFNRAYQP